MWLLHSYLKSTTICMYVYKMAELVHMYYSEILRKIASVNVITCFYDLKSVICK